MPKPKPFICRGNAVDTISISRDGRNTLLIKLANGTELSGTLSEAAWSKLPVAAVPLLTLEMPAVHEDMDT